MKITAAIEKAPTGVAGFDYVTGGGLPRGRTTLVEGGPGSGKTVLALQTLVNGARENGEPGIFVAFEESSARIVTNAASFGWNLPELQSERLFFLDAQTSAEVAHSGDFDLGGMLAALGAKADEMGARRIAFDAVDVVLALLDDPAAARREIHRLHEWLLERELTAVLTSKATTDPRGSLHVRPHDFMQFMVDCAVVLGHDVVDGVSQRNLRVRKYRGSAFEENVTPFVIGAEGMEVASTPSRSEEQHAPVSVERVSTGIERLDDMLGGGYYRGASILLTGAPGTAKTTLCGAFAAAACARGEPTLFVSFDSGSEEIVRNLRSVGIDLAPHIDAGLLRMHSARAVSGSAEIHLMRIKQLADAHGARCLVVDPLSALSKGGNRPGSHGIAERLIDWTKTGGLTLLCTSLLADTAPEAEGTPLQISTIADTWIHLSYIAHAGERNRGLSIIKSRGTGHSNQVRELLLSDEGVSLSDVYTAGGEVLMGTLRWAQERAEAAARQERSARSERERIRLQAEADELDARVRLLQAQLEMKRAEQASLSRTEAERVDELARADSDLRERRAPRDGHD